nr:hypothetical protein [Paraglaciecola sp. MB-3u-78]
MNNPRRNLLKGMAITGAALGSNVALSFATSASESKSKSLSLKGLQRILPHAEQKGVVIQMELFNSKIIFVNASSCNSAWLLMNSATDVWEGGFGYQGSASRQGWGRDVAEMDLGANLKDAISEPGPWTIGMTAFGEMLPGHSNRIYLDPKKTDKWGLPYWPWTLLFEITKYACVKICSRTPSICSKRQV